MLASTAGAAVMMPPAMPAAAAVVQEVAARDAVIGWFRGEFAAANAIIDALCGHLAQIGGSADYEAVFVAIHRRRLNWIPVLLMQKYYSIADVSAELRRVAASKKLAVAADLVEERSEIGPCEEEIAVAMNAEDDERGKCEKVVASEEEMAGSSEEDSAGDSSSDPKFLEEADAGDDAGSNGEQASLEHTNICTNQDICIARPERIKILKGFMAKEPVKGHMVNVVKGLKLFEDVFTDSELSKLGEYVNERRQAGRRGELSGNTFIYFNKEMKGSKREIIQLGVPLFQHGGEQSRGENEPIPEVLQTLIDHLCQWRLIPETRKPNSCVINFFDEEEHSQPYQKPPHVDNPITTLLLSDTTMTFGRTLASDDNNSYRGSLTLQLKEGSLLVMRGNSADMARHVICSSPNKRVIVSFIKVRPSCNPNDQPVPAVSPVAKAMTLWQPGPTVPQKIGSAGAIGYGANGLVPPWNIAFHSPVIMVPPQPVPMGPARKESRSGTGVFLPWTVGPKKHTRHLPPRIQKRRIPSLPLAIEA